MRKSTEPARVVGEVVPPDVVVEELELEIVVGVDEGDEVVLEVGELGRISQRV